MTNATDTIEILYSAKLDASKLLSEQKKIDREIVSSQEAIDKNFERMLRLQSQNAKTMSKYHQAELERRQAVIKTSEKQLRLAAQKLELLHKEDNYYKLSANAVRNKTSLMAALTGQQKVLNTQLDREVKLREKAAMRNTFDRVVAGPDRTKKHSYNDEVAALKALDKEKRKEYELLRNNYKQQERTVTMSKRIAAATSKVTESITRENRAKKIRILESLRTQAVRTNNLKLARTINAEIKKETELLYKNTAVAKRNAAAKRDKLIGTGTGNNFIGKGKRPGFIDTMRGRTSEGALVGSTFGHKMATTLQYATAGTGIYTMFRAFKSATEAALEFDAVQRRLEAVLNVGAETSEAMALGLEDLSIAYGGTISEINEAALALGRAGVANEDLVRGTDKVIKLSMLTGDTIANTTSVLSTFRQTYGEAAGSVSVLADNLAYAANKSRLATSDLGTLSNYALSAAQATGVTSEQVLAMATAFSNAGVNASTIGTQIRKFSIMLRQSTPNVEKFYATLGLRQSELLSQFQNGEADKAFTKIVKTIASASQEAYNAATADLDIRQRDTIDKFRLTADKMLGHLKDLNTGVAKGMTDNADTIALSYEKVFERVRNSLLTLTNTKITDGLNEVFGTLTSKDVDHRINQLTGTVQALGTTLKFVVATLVAYKVQMFVANAAQLAFGRGAVALTGDIAVLRGAIVALTGPLGLAVAAISALGLAITASNAIRNTRLAERAALLKKLRENARAAAAAEKKLQKEMWGTNEATRSTLATKIADGEKQRESLKKTRDFLKKSGKDTTTYDAIIRNITIHIQTFTKALAVLDQQSKARKGEIFPVSPDEVQRLRAVMQLISKQEARVRDSKLPEYFTRIASKIKQQVALIKKVYSGATKLNLDKLLSNKTSASEAQLLINTRILELEHKRLHVGTLERVTLDKEIGNLKEIEKLYQPITKMKKMIADGQATINKDNARAFQHNLTLLKDENTQSLSQQKIALGRVSALRIARTELESQRALLAKIQSLEVVGQKAQEGKARAIAAQTAKVKKSELKVARANIAATDAARKLGIKVQEKQIALIQDNVLRSTLLAKLKQQQYTEEMKRQQELAAYDKEKYDELIKLNDELVRRQIFGYTAYGQVITEVSGELEQSFMTFFDISSKGFLDLRTLALDVANDIYKAMVRAMIVKPLVNGIASGVTNMFLHADGGVHNSPSLSAYSNSIVSSPTPFLFANGGAPNLGIMGEAGSEAILPLSKTPSGQLGVKAVSGAENVTVKIVNESGNALKVTNSQVSGDYGNMIISVVVDALQTNKGGLRTALGR